VLVDEISILMPLDVPELPLLPEEPLPELPKKPPAKKPPIKPPPLDPPITPDELLEPLALDETTGIWPLEPYKGGGSGIGAPCGVMITWAAPWLVVVVTVRRTTRCAGRARTTRRTTRFFATVCCCTTRGLDTRSVT
jgi:hypothetical protein